jgi:hypothetical protein
MAMKVSDILRVKGNTLYALGPDQTLWQAVQTMAGHDIDSVDAGYERRADRRRNAEGLHPRLAGAGER